MKLTVESSDMQLDQVKRLRMYYANLAKHANPLCVSCHRWVGRNDVKGYTVNPPGGYGRDEFCICLECLPLEQNEDIYKRLEELNVLEERDKKK